ncbi:stage II sporulation protein P [Alkalihalobacterium chitinilyticum]|uniref:Stage II sporulation protein P n=1 Tax=Alkalihalobacterium chitinilyticum TaxID=2980103 RepID=A0ABT5VC53_9BACI|nr:stage II sporulation protein P [Alkalihalobacterium chitinilyticum]MDE5412741.1 stage II sporulation protein P [Alkalihalobacterium chitinilyticum]
MDRNEELELLRELKKSHSNITPNEEFVERLEGKLVQRFSARSKNKLMLPVTGAIFASILFLLLVFNIDGLFQQPAEYEEEVEVYIYHTHTWEAFLPELEIEVNEDDEFPGAHAWDRENNITAVGEHLSNELTKRGIVTIHDSTDFQSILDERGLKYTDSYDVSRENVEEVLTQHDNIQMVFDIHRDSLSRNQTTTTINGEEVARIYFNVGGELQQKRNLDFARELHLFAEEMYPGLSRGVVETGGLGRNGIYNQDLHDQAILIDIGGYENSLEEAMRAATYLADVVEVLLEK